MYLRDHTSGDMEVGEGGGNDWAMRAMDQRMNDASRARTSPPCNRMWRPLSLLCANHMSRKNVKTPSGKSVLRGGGHRPVTTWTPAGSLPGHEPGHRGHGRCTNRSTAGRETGTPAVPQGHGRDTAGTQAGTPEGPQTEHRWIKPGHALRHPPGGIPAGTRKGVGGTGHASGASNLKA